MSAVDNGMLTIMLGMPNIVHHWRPSTIYHSSPCVRSKVTHQISTGWPWGSMEERNKTRRRVSPLKSARRTRQFQSRLTTPSFSQDVRLGPQDVPVASASHAGVRECSQGLFLTQYTFPERVPTTPPIPYRTPTLATHATVSYQ